MGKRLLVLHGPNLNLLGEREGRQGGRLADLDVSLMSRAQELGLELKVVQSNHEGVLIDTLHAERSRLDGVVVSPAGLFGSYPLREALEAVGLPTLEVYLERLGERESVVAEACVATVEGQGFRSYLEALERFASGDLAGDLSDEEEDAAEEDAPGEDEEAEAPEESGKTIGRRGKASAAKASGAKASGSGAAAETPGKRKTLGRKAEAPAASASPSKTLGRKAPEAQQKVPENVLSRALVRQKIAERLAGRLSPADLVSWSRTRWMDVQRGAAAEAGQRDLLEDTLQRLTLSTTPASRLSDADLLDMMTRLDR